MKLNFACKSCGRSRVARMEPCHWSKGYVGVSLPERQATMQVMLGVSLQARWDATLVTTTLLCCLLRFKAVFQTLLSSSSAVLWSSISFGHGRPGRSTFSRHFGSQSVLPCLNRPADRSRPLHHQPSARLHKIAILLSFYKSMLPQSISSHYIPK